MTALQLSPAQRKEKRAEAHHLEPVVLVGTAGATPAVERELDAALAAHGLVKVRVAVEDRAEREALLERLADRLGAAPVQHIGKLLVLWRPPVERGAAERDDRLPGPRVVKIVKFSKSGNHRPQVKKITIPGNMRLTAGGQLKRARKRASSVKKPGRSAP
jgi:putative YhbY family RNA-binding protein